MTSPTISIVIPTHNRWDMLSRTLESVASVARPADVAVEVIVVANACSDDTQGQIDALAQRFPIPLRCVADPVAGLNHARNMGVESSTGKYVWFLDDDVQVDPQALIALLATYTNQYADLVGARVDLWWEAVERPEWLADDLLWILSGTQFGDEGFHSVDGAGLIGACFSFRRAVYESIGPFTIGLDRVGKKLLGGGESEFIQRAIRGGFRAYHAPDMRVKHWVPPHRLRGSYIRGVGRGYGEARIYLKPRLTALGAIRSFAGHLFLAVWHGAASLIPQPYVSRLRHQVRASMGSGGLKGLLTRCVSMHPTRHR